MSRSTPLPTDLSFDKSGPFYPLIVDYLILLFGVPEMLARGLVARFVPDSPRGRLVPALEDLRKRVQAACIGVPEDEGRKLLAQMEEVIEGGRKLEGPLQLASAALSTPLEAHRDSLAVELLEDCRSKIESLKSAAAGHVLVSAHAVSSQHTDHGLLWEFFRHVRNAAGHGGQFTFKKSEPSRPAEWRGIKIDRSLQGASLFRLPSRSGLIDFADPILLLADVERACPALRPSGAQVPVTWTRPLKQAATAHAPPGPAPEGGTSRAPP